MRAEAMNVSTATLNPASTIPFLFGRLGAPFTVVQGKRTTQHHTPGGTVERQDFDAQYLSRLAAGDASVEKHFTIYFAEFLHIKLRRRNWSRPEIEDFCQETFLRVLRVVRERGGLAHPACLGAFVNSVCNHVISEFCKARGKHSALDEEAYDLIDQSIDLDGRLLAEERKKMVRDILEELPEADRELLRMIFLEEADRDEVCRTMNVDRDYLRVLLHRALTRFKALASKDQQAAFA
jgi:RNA polymerase sigma-70 factor (ECF subfamily)